MTDSRHVESVTRLPRVMTRGVLVQQKGLYPYPAPTPGSPNPKPSGGGTGEAPRGRPHAELQRLAGLQWSLVGRPGPRPARLGAVQPWRPQAKSGRAQGL